MDESDFAALKKAVIRGIKEEKGLVGCECVIKRLIKWILEDTMSWGDKYAVFVFRQY